MMQTRVLFGIIGALMCVGTATASVIEAPGANDEMSGIYFFAGWKCAQGALSGRIDGGAAFPLAGLIERPDTASVCNDTNNGWIAQYNYNRLSQGTHTFEAFDGAASFASVTFQVVHFGEEFKTGVTGSGTSTLSDGSTATLTWRQSLQAFIMTQATPGQAEDADAILARCPTPSEVAVSDFDLDLVFEADPTAGQIVCTAAQSSKDLTLWEAQTYRILTIMRQLDFDEPLPWTDKSLYEWMVSSIDGIRFRDDIENSFCCTNDMINVKATDNAYWLQDPTDFRYSATMMTLFVHEARHNNGKPHTCGLGNDNAVPGSDNTLSELGSWGAVYYTQHFLATKSDPTFIPPAMHPTFLSSAQTTCSSRFCEDSCP